MSDKKSWYDTGYSGLERENERIARGNGPNRFWMKAGTTREIVFLDDEPLCLYEHNPKIGKSWTNWVTCVKDTHDNAVCCDKLGDKSRYYVGFYSVVDLTKSTDEKSKNYQFEVKLFPAKRQSLGLIRRKKESRGSLIGAKFKVTRDSEDNPSIGNDFEYEKDIDLDQLFKIATYKGKKLSELYKEALDKPEVLKRIKDTFQATLSPEGLLLPRVAPFNYFELLQPKEPAELKRFLANATTDNDFGGGSSGTSAPAAQDDDIPF